MSLVAAAALLMVSTSLVGHAAVVVVMGEYAILPPSMTSARPLTSVSVAVRKVFLAYVRKWRLMLGLWGRARLGYNTSRL